MTQRLLNTIPKDIWKLSDIFTDAGFDLFLVGGCVRDALLDKDPKDFDLATNATPDQIRKILKGSFRTKAVGEAFGVILVLTECEDFEIATFRKDIGDDGRKPESVEFTTIEEDVKRRDLTINGLFFDLHSKEIVDLVGGATDLANNVVKTIGSAKERFEEDHLRKLRAIRFASIMGESAVFDADIFRELKRNPGMPKVSPERLRDEFLKMFHKAASIEHALELLNEFEMLSQIFGHFIPFGFIDRTDMDSFKNVESVLVRIFLATSLSPKESRSVLHEAKWTNVQCDTVEFMLKIIQTTKFCSSMEHEKLIVSTRISEITKQKRAIVNGDKTSLDKLREIASEVGVCKSLDLVDLMINWTLTVKRNHIDPEKMLHGSEIAEAIKTREAELFRACL